MSKQGQISEEEASIRALIDLSDLISNANRACY